MDKSLLVAAQVFERLSKMPGASWEKVMLFMQRIISEPAYRRQIWNALTGQIVVDELTCEEWVEREIAVFEKLNNSGIPMPTREQLEKAWFEGCGQNHRYVPAGLNRRQLLDACHKAGIRLNGGNPQAADFNGGDQLPTERGTLQCDLERMMTPTDAKHRPCMLNFAAHTEWAIELGGDSITSVEETLYLILRAWVELARIPFMGGWIRCCNRRGSDSSLEVSWRADRGLSVSCGGIAGVFWYCGAVARKFRPSAL